MLNVWPAMLIAVDRGWLDGVPSTVRVTVPGPVPLWPDVTRTHGTGAAAVVQTQPGLVLTATETGPPWLGTLVAVGLIAKVQPELWLIVNGRPAIVTMPLRAGPVVAATVNCRVPFPLRAPSAIVIHVALLVAVQSHPATVVTATAPDPPALVTENVSGLMLKRQPLFCVTLKTCGPMRNVPVRRGPSHAPTLNVTVAAPVPDLAEVIDIHSASLCADHGQPAAVVTLIAPEPPPALMVCDAGAMAIVQPTP